MYARPVPGESDEDLLRLQEEFFRQRAENKIKPAAKFINDNKSEERPENQPKSNVEATVPAVVPVSAVMGKIIVLSDVIVKPVDESNFQFTRGFPQAKRRQGNILPKKGVSIFAQQNKRLRPENYVANIPQPLKNVSSHIEPLNEFFKFKNKSSILMGPEKNDLHEENVEKLSGFTEEEILEEQQQLMSNLDPELIRFLKSKRGGDNKEENVQNMEIDVAKKQDVPIEYIETAKDIIDAPNSEKWLHFDSIEIEKLQWMNEIKIPKKLESDEPYEARFDFSGWLLPYVEEISEKTRSLYHHGEDPERPGYTLQELLKLCRSNVPQQRILALNTISNIVSLSTTGVYENIIDIPIEQIFFIVRVCLDENIPTVLNASIRALHSIFCHQLDETLLDCMTGFNIGYVQPILTIDNGNVGKNDVKEINDQQLAEMDLVKCLARTDILVRIRYIISTIMPPLETINYCLMILIRLVRDSFSILTDVYNCQNLFENIIRYFIPKTQILSAPNPNFAYGFPVLFAIKLLRVTASRSKHIAQELVEKYGVLDTLCLYLSNDVARNTNEVKIQAESLHLFAVFAHYNLGKANFVAISGILLRSLNYHLNNTNIDDQSTYSLQNHFSGIVNLLSELSKNDFNIVKIFYDALMQFCIKYTAQTSKYCDFKCGKLQIISSLMVCLANFIEFDRNCLVESERCVEKMLNFEGFSRITQNAKSNSNLLCKYDPFKTSANFNTMQGAVWGTSEHVVPNLQTKSPLPFLMALSYYIKKSSVKLQSVFLKHAHIHDYLNEIKSAKKLNLMSNWFTRIEAKLLMNVLICAVNSQSLLSDQTFYYELAVKTLGVYNHEQRNEVAFVLKNIIFNKNFYGNEVLLKNLWLDNKHGTLSCLNNLEDVYECYIQILDLKKISFMYVTSLCLDVRLGNLLPIDWVFSPIVSLYAQQQEKNSQKDEERDLPILKICLQWIFTYEYNFPELASSVDITDRYCRLSCTFLCSNSLFLDDHVHYLLEQCFKLLISGSNLGSIDFNKEIQGLNNFQDFYTQLLEQYQAVSYGDALFANFILLPLAQRFNVKWRKAFWSEYAGVAQILSLREDQLFMDVREFLEPYETDMSLLENYLTCIHSGSLQRSPILKKIVINHLENYR